MIPYRIVAMAGRGSGDHLGSSQQKSVDPGGGGDSMLAAAAKRLRQEMVERRRPHPLPPSATASSSIQRPTSLPVTAPRVIRPPHLPPVVPVAGRESPESRNNSLAHLVR